MWQVGIMRTNADGVITGPVTDLSTAIFAMQDALGRSSVAVEAEEAEAGLWLVEMTDAEVEALMSGSFPGTHDPRYVISIEKP